MRQPKLVFRLRRLVRLSGRWWQYITDPGLRRRFARFGLIGLVPLIMGAAGPTLVQSVAGNHTGGNTATVVANISSTQAGNLLVVYAIGSQITAVTYSASVTAGTAQTFVAWPNSPNAAQTGVNLNCWYVLSCAAGSTQVTITRSSGTGQSAVIVEEWSGGTWSVGLGNTASGTLTTTLTTGTAASQTCDLALACVADSLGTSQPTLSTPTNGWTAQTFATGDNAPTNTAFKGLQSLNLISPGTGTFGTGMTASVTPDAFAGMVLGFVLAGGAGAPGQFTSVGKPGPR